MKAFLRTHHFLEAPIVPATPDPNDEEEKERYISRQLWVALIGLALFALVLLFGWGGAQAAGTSPTAATLFARTTDLGAALERARREGRSGVAVLYEMDGCGECARLKSTTFKDATLRRELGAHFVAVSLRADEPIALRDFDGRATTQAAFANEQRVYALPTLVFYDLDGTPVARQPGARWPVSEWLRLARYVREAGYERAPFAPLASATHH